MATPSGKLLGRYEIVSEIGRGAMGTVYKARDPKIDRVVAIKTILIHQSSAQEQREFRDRFFVEAQAAGRLLHPGIVTVFDVGEDPETSDPYIVMEYIEGPTLRDLLAENNNRLQMDDAMQVTIELAEALDYAHSQGVVHRDIKPANILVNKEGQAKISDFGIAQLDLTHITVPGRVLGTPAYMSPEQLEGQQVDGRSDLFSLGAILYSALTGFSPFQGNSATTVCYKVANHEPLEASALAPHLPVELDAVITRALAKDPEKRYQRGTEFARELRQLREGMGSPSKGKLWFSTSVGRPRFLDGTIKIPVGTGSGGAATAAPVTHPSKKIAAPKPTPKPATVQKTLKLFSSPKVQRTAAVTVFLVAVLLNIYSWRQLRTHRIEPAAVENVGQASDVESTENDHTATQTGTTPKGLKSKKAETDATSVLAAVSKAASPARAKTAAHPVRKAASPATSQAAAQANAQAVAPIASTPKNAGRASGTTGGPAPVVAPVASATPPPAPAHPDANLADSNLEVRIENHFADANIKIWVDEKLAYEHGLRDGHKKRLILLGGGAREKVTIPFASGHHAVRVQVQSATEQYDETKTIAGDFGKGTEKILSINFEKHTKEMRLALGTE